MQAAMFFLVVIVCGLFSCVKTVDKNGGIQDADNSGNSEKALAAGEKTEMAEDALSINPPAKKPEIDFSKDAIENGIDLNDIRTVLTIYRWTTEFEVSHISFEPDNTYRLFTAPEGAGFGSGTYHVEGNTITVNYPSETELWKGLPETTMKWLFADRNPLVLAYDKEYRDFRVLTCLRFEDKMLKNYAIESPFDEEYELDGFEVVKYRERERESRVLVLENLRMRELPEITADTVTLEREIYVTDADTGYYVAKSFASDIVYAHTVETFDAKTVKTDTIDGITAPWYRLRIVLNDFAPRVAVWVFGGYLKELAPKEHGNIKEDLKYIQSLFDNGIIEKRFGSKDISLRTIIFNSERLQY
jgi:hypothetical protein